MRHLFGGGKRRFSLATNHFLTKIRINKEFQACKICFCLVKIWRADGRGGGEHEKFLLTSSPRTTLFLVTPLIKTIKFCVCIYLNHNYFWRFGIKRYRLSSPLIPHGGMRECAKFPLASFNYILWSCLGAFCTKLTPGFSNDYIYSAFV